MGRNPIQGWFPVGFLLHAVCITALIFVSKLDAGAGVPVSSIMRLMKLKGGFFSAERLVCINITVLKDFVY